MFTRVLGRYVASTVLSNSKHWFTTSFLCRKAVLGVCSLVSTQTFRRALTALVDRCGEIKSAQGMASPVLAEFG